jgi:hypothetical protein
VPGSDPFGGGDQTTGGEGDDEPGQAAAFDTSEHNKEKNLKKSLNMVMVTEVEIYWKELLMNRRGRKPYWWVIPGGLAPTLFFLLNILSPLSFPGPAQAQNLNLNPKPPAAAVRLVFIHHSVGANWLSDDNGNLLSGLNANNYYVADTYYDWGQIYDPADPDSGPIGDHTDMGYWYDWFLGPRSGLFLADLYATTHHTPPPDMNGGNSIAQPAGDNTVVLFKSCFISG